MIKNKISFSTPNSSYSVSLYRWFSIRSLDHLYHLSVVTDDMVTENGVLGRRGSDILLIRDQWSHGLPAQQVRCRWFFSSFSSSYKFPFMHLVAAPRDLLAVYSIFSLFLSTENRLRLVSHLITYLPNRRKEEGGLRKDKETKEKWRYP